MQISLNFHTYYQCFFTRTKGNILHAVIVLQDGDPQERYSRADAAIMHISSRAWRNSHGLALVCVRQCVSGLHKLMKNFY
eukprot:m.615596 g.615596  ORF g.615596 m.615596 type:complete len:80 (+) comp22508_c1_seq3:95-334(+)